MGNFAHMADIWTNTPVALALANSRSFAGAARALNIDRTTVARRLAALEAALGGRLFDRDEGQLVLTPFGRQFVGHAEAAEEKLAAAAGAATQNSVEPEGAVRLSIAPNLMPVIAPTLLALAQSYPRLQLRVFARYALDDIENRDTDIALRVLRGNPDASLHSCKLQDVRGAIYRARSAPQSGAPFIGRAGETTRPDYMEEYLSTDFINLVVEGINEHAALVAAGGQGRMALFMGDANPKLVRISDPLPPEGWALWLVTHPALKDSPRVRAVFNRLKDITL